MIEQGSDEWKLLRAGKVTASRVADIISKTKTGYSASRENYLTELVIERVGVMGESFTNAAMEHGTETEPLARAEYEVINNVIVDQVDFFTHPKIKESGASPDGLVGLYGLVEFKCPNSKTHFKYLLDDVIPNKYKPQMAWQMACTGARWCDFVSYDNRVPEGLQYFQIRYDRDNEYIDTLENEVVNFLIEVDKKYDELNEKIQLRKAA